MGGSGLGDDIIAFHGPVGQFSDWTLIDLFKALIFQWAKSKAAVPMPRWVEWVSDMREFSTV